LEGGPGNRGSQCTVLIKGKKRWHLIGGHGLKGKGCGAVFTVGNKTKHSPIQVSEKKGQEGGVAIGGGSNRKAKHGRFFLPPGKRKGKIEGGKKKGSASGSGNISKGALKNTFAGNEGKKGGKKGVRLQ